MSKNFDESNIALTFSAMTDTHISGSWYQGPSKQKFINALEYAREVAKKPIDAYVFAGDFVDCMNSRGNVLLSEKWGLDYDNATAEQSAREFETLRYCFKNHIPEEAEIIYCLGNHDSTNLNNIDRFITEFSSRDEIGDNKNFERMYRTDLDINSMRKGMRHCFCKGYHFLCVDLVTDYKETIDFLKVQLDCIIEKEPNKYVFVICHYHTPGTVYGSDVGKSEYAAAIGRLLKNYPQVIYFSGHEHTTVCNERAIMQAGYTAVEGSCVSYVDASHKREINVFHEMHFKLSESLLFEIDKDGNVRITRLDNYNKKIIKDAWELPYPKADGSHLTAYASDRKYKVEKPKFPENADFTLEETEDGVKITIDKAIDNNDSIFRYQVILYNSSGLPKVYYLSSLFCYRADEGYNKDTVSAIIPEWSLRDIYKVTVTAQDFWYNDSEPLVKYKD